MTPHCLLGGRVLAGACALLVAGLTSASAQFLPGPSGSTPAGQFPPPPGQTQAAQDPAFPPPPGQTRAAPPRQDPAFPPPPGQTQVTRQDSAFPPPPVPGQADAPAGFGPGPASGGFGPAPSGGSFSAAPSGGFAAGPRGPSEAQKVCLTFPAIREDVEKEFGRIKTASDRKASRQEACSLFKSAVVKEAKMLKFLETNRTLCGVPLQAIKQVKANHTNTIRIRNQLCSAGPAGPAPGPSLSDALGAPIIADDSNAKKPGRGTFDTLTGNVLSR